jgi:uncharacterized protein YjbI with pentapeptide repeats
MANEDHKRLILQGVDQWNTWRYENYDLKLTPDLSNVDLYNTNLIGADFAFTNLSGANLAFADLSGANLAFANLTEANFHRSKLIDAQLMHANLAKANLTEVIFVETLFQETDFMNAVFGHTVLANLNLRECKNLNTIQHKEPSALSIDTIMRSEGAMPIEFLRGIGLNERFISFLLTLSQN